MQEVLSRMPQSVRARLVGRAMGRVNEIRLRVGRPLELRGDVGADGLSADELVGGDIDKDELGESVRMLMDHSVYAFEEQMRQGFFTLPGGFRVGLTGEFALDGDSPRQLTNIGSISIRVARALPGCADSLMPWLVYPDGAPRSALILSPPLMGKTTMLRDIARQLSERGFHVGIADERSELAGCREGAPLLDVGPRTDVCDGLPKRLAIPLLIRSMSPDVVVTDELGCSGDAEAVAEAARSGVRVVASAHAASYDQAMSRKALSAMLADKLFSRVVILGGQPGRVVDVLDENGDRL